MINCTAKNVNAAALFNLDIGSYNRISHRESIGFHALSGVAFPLHLQTTARSPNGNWSTTAAGPPLKRTPTFYCKSANQFSFHTIFLMNTHKMSPFSLA
jgi:hypothetical protein